MRSRARNKSSGKTYQILIYKLVNAQIDKFKLPNLLEYAKT